ncbi:MAG: DUF11 domain-containing protein, partial [Woeseiaceae bacterium]|nr:DUF11 domain-containing protein [Woeseiaceae bacterium]
VITYTVGGTATEGTDYAPLSGTVTIPAGSTTATIDIAGIVADGLVEGTETIEITVTGITASDPGVTIDGSNDTATISLVDGDTATVSVAPTNDGDESGPVDGVFTLTQSAVAVSDTAISYTVGGTATEGTDYTALSGAVTIPAGSTTATIDIAGIVADSLVEGTETVTVTLTAITASDPGITIDAANDNASIDILDGDAATVSIAGTTDGNEAGPVDGVFTVTQSTSSVSDTVITYTVGGTATEGTDYAPLSGTVTIPAGSTTATIDIAGIIADSLVEGDETIEITLTGISASDPGVTLDAGAGTSTITLLDGDAAAVSIAATTDGDETGPVDGVFTLTQSTVAVSDTVISYTVGGTASSGSDYTALSGNVTIPAGDTTATIIVPVLDDGLAEAAETVEVILTAITSGEPGISVAPSPDDRATLSIIDDDANLVTTKSVSNATPDEGETIIYTLTVANAGGAPVSNVSLTDVLPAGVTYVGDSSAGAYDNTTGLWTIGNVGTAAPDDIATLNITVIVDAGASSLPQPIVNTTTAAVADLPDIDTTGDVLTAAITVSSDADLVTTKVVDNASPVETDTIVYTLTVSNNGAARATNVSLVDSLPAGISYVSDDSGGAYNAVTGQWTIDTLEDGEIVTLNITATVDAGAGALPQPITNVTTAASGDQPDPDVTTDDLSAAITVNYNADLVTTKTVDVQSPGIGEPVVYTLTVTNNGPAPATNVSLTDVLPTGVEWVSDDSGGAYDAATGLWTIGDLPNGGIAMLNITVVVTPEARSVPQAITNTATPAVGDQVDPDTTTDDLSEDILVTAIDSTLIQLVKTVGREQAVPGEIVSYSIEIRNNTAWSIADAFVHDTPARGFKYVPGTAMLDGVPIDDPSLGLPLVFDIGTLPGRADTNGNGIADPGEDGYRVLSYRMVAGSGVAPGVWSNSALTMLDCEDCVVSNTATADIEIVEDTLFDLGTIIGKVFYDADEDGWQDPDEGGIAAAMVALDDGTYVLTDAYGRYHFPAVRPGQRLLKINLHSLAGRAVATNDKTRILNVTPGLMAKANFGVKVDTVGAAIGRDGVTGVNVDSGAWQPPVLINGSTIVPSLLVNGEPASIATADVILGTAKLEDVVELRSGAVAEPIRFTPDVDGELDVSNWTFVVDNAGGETVFERAGTGAPPTEIAWDGIGDNGKLIVGGQVYAYQLTLESADGHELASSRRLFGVNRRNSVSLNLAGGAFITGSHDLTKEAMALLSETAEAIRAYPDEMIVISGHTDSVGTDESNLALSERRARTAFDYLTKAEKIPAERFIIQAYGESRPIADNDTAWGRELNRRVEISGDLSKTDLVKNYDPHRQPPSVSINGRSLDIDERGRFAGELELDAASDSMHVLLGTSQGRTVETVVPLPTIEVLSPIGTFSIPFDNDVPGDTGRLMTELAARTEPGNTVEVNGERVEVDSEGRFATDITMQPGENHYGIVARNPMGVLRIANLKLVVDDGADGEPLVVVDPTPKLALTLPPPGVPLSNSHLVVHGSTAPGNSVYINDAEIQVDERGGFTATLSLEQGDNPFTARVVDADGNTGEIERSFEYGGEGMFFMALLDGKFTQLKTSGSLQAAGADESDEFVSEGRIAYYLKGHVLGKYLLTSAFDSGQRKLGELFSDLTEQDNERLLTNLDPDTLYPVYGDDSTLVYDAQSLGKFYIALESETLQAMIGNYALNFTDTELAAYQRTLYGASVSYQSEPTEEGEKSRTTAQAFHANIEQAHVRDELRATGGSLYYLSQRDVIEGSEHVSVIVRDQDSGLILERRALLQGLDYTIDYVDGRLLSNGPISSVRTDSSLVDSNILGGNAVYLQIDYETRVDGFEQTSSGGRVRQRVGDRLTLGATSIDEDQLAGEYSLKATDAEYRFSDKSRLVAEFATSEGNNSVAYVSEDGGLTYQAVAQDSGASGEAFKIAAEIDAGEWFGWEDRLLVNTYYKRLDTGFSANAVTSEQGSEKSGIGTSWKISDRNMVRARYELQKYLLDGSENSMGTLQWNLTRDNWGLAAELEDRSGQRGDATIAAARLTNRWTDRLSTNLEHQQTLSGEENDQSTFGVNYRATDRLSLDARATRGTLGESAQLGAQFDWRGNRFYVAQTFKNSVSNGIDNGRLAGVAVPFGPDGELYSEYQWNDLASGAQRQRMVGARQRFKAGNGLTVQLSGEHSAHSDAMANEGDRYAVAAKVSYENESGLRFSTRNEFREDTRAMASEQFLSSTQLTLPIGTDLSVVGKYRFSKSESQAQVERNIDFTEASIGLAYRPVAHDRLNLLTRYTKLSNTPTVFQTASMNSGASSDIFAVDWSYQLSRRIEWVGKQAMRWSEYDDDPLGNRSLTALSIHRLNWTLPRDFLLGTEFRRMTQDLADDERSGFVTEVMWEGLDPLRLGIGYNFSDVSDNEHVEYDFSTRGFFMRLQGKF